MKPIKLENCWICPWCGRKNPHPIRLEIGGEFKIAYAFYMCDCGYFYIEKIVEQTVGQRVCLSIRVRISEQ